MRRVIVFTLLLAVVGATAAIAERPTNPGKPNPGKPRPADDLYGDLYIIERNADTGEPWLDDEGCVRPLYADCGFIPLLYETTDPIPEEDDPCEVDPAFADFLQPIDLGRMSVTRSPQYVIDQAYVESIKRINAADTLGIDPAGRINYEIDGEWKTIDSPLENLALYQQVMKFGWLEDIVLDVDGESWIRSGVPLVRDLTAFGLEYLNDDAMTVEDFDRAASFLAAAADKTSFVSRDAIVTVNTYTAINVVTPGETPPDDVSIDYFSYAGYGYDQDKCYPAHVDTTLLVPFDCPVEIESEQCFYADLVNISEQEIFKALGFCEAEALVPYDPLDSGGLLQFTQAVEHSRAVINFLHNWSVPVMF